MIRQTFKKNPRLQGKSHHLSVHVLVYCFKLVKCLLNVRWVLNVTRTCHQLVRYLYVYLLLEWSEHPVVV